MKKFVVLPFDKYNHMLKHFEDTSSVGSVETDKVSTERNIGISPALENTSNKDIDTLSTTQTAAQPSPEASSSLNSSTISQSSLGIPPPGEPDFSYSFSALKSRRA